MLPELELLPGALSEIMASSSESGYLTLCDRYGLLAAMLSESLNENEQRCVNRLLRSTIRGRIQVANLLSSAASLASPRDDDSQASGGR